MVDGRRGRSGRRQDRRSAELGWVRGTAVRHRAGSGAAGKCADRGRAASGAHAAAHAGRVRRPGAPARRGLGAAHRDRVGSAALDDPLRAARQWQDDPGPHGSGAGRSGLRGGERGAGRPSGGARGARARAAQTSGGRDRDDLLPRRDPPLQQGPAGRSAAGGRGGPGDADRSDHGEPLLRGQQRAPVAHAGLRAAAASGRSDRGAAAPGTGRSASAASPIHRRYRTTRSSSSRCARAATPAPR